MNTVIKYSLTNLGCAAGALALLLVTGCSLKKDKSAGGTDAPETSSQQVAGAAGAIGKVSFNQQVRPIISDRCFACHGPDVDNQESPFRLDTQEASRMNLAKEGEPPRYGVVPGKPGESLLLTRILHEDPSERMPPPAAKKKTITPEELAILRQWILDGAEYEEHWAFASPVRPEPPAVKNTAWVRNNIDRFVLAQLESKNIQPAPEADKETLIRRLYIDLMGLPPTPEEIDSFIKDPSDTAFENLVDRVMASAHYGERMAIDWLDTARYGDSNAIHIDLERTSWPWRDWVIRAFNSNMPYDQFIVEQLAGDLLPNPTVQQKVATSFNRHHGINNEGGTIPEEFLVEYAVDRVSTMGTAFMGLTLGCARCHDHKFDPITQDDFFSLMSFFNNIPEKGRESVNEFEAYAYPPYVYVYTDEEEQQLASAKTIMAEVTSLKNLTADKRPSLPGDEQAVVWNALTLSKVHSDKTKLPKVLSVKTQKELGRNAKNRIAQIQDTKKVHFRAGIGTDAALTLTFKSPGTPFNTLRIEATPSANKGGGETYDIDYSDSVISEIEVELHQGKTIRKVELDRGYASLDRKGNLVAAAIDKEASSNWNLGTPAYHHHLFIRFKEPITEAQGEELVVRLRYKGTQPSYKFHNDLVFYAGNNPHGQDEPVALIAQHERANWHKDALLISACNQAGLTRLTAADHGWAAARETALKKTATRCMVMEEHKQVKPTYVLYRGLYDQPLKDRPRERTTPAAFSALAAEAPKNRLGLARWLVAEDNPLTARVSVNRFWQQLFGNGIVKTSEDFGLQSDPPSHPELLDYLAVDFRENNWDVKRLIKELVTTATYRQSSRHRDNLKEIDPENRLLARAPRYRFPAEVIRDNALAASGLLNAKVGGPSVKPYQPDGLWREKTMRPAANTAVYKRDTGANLYRRGMYTFWKQAVPPPQMELFDAPSREACVVKRRTTTTPLQALVLMNDETYLEISRELATRLFKEIDGPWEAKLQTRIERGLRLTTGRTPSPEELASWVRFTGENLKRFAEEPGNAKEFLSYGEKPADASLPETELAALSFTMSTMLNLDETITRD